MASRLDFGPQGVEKLKGWHYPVAASQLFNPLGGSIVYMDTNGRVTLALTATATVFGWADIPHSWVYGTDDHTNRYWTSSSTAGADRVFVYPFVSNPGMTLWMPSTAAGGLSVQARVGELCDIVAVNDGTVQYAVPGTHSTDILHFVALVPDGETNSAYFTVNNAKYQADT